MINLALSIAPFSWFADLRLSRVFFQMLDRFSKHFGENLPQCAVDNAQLQSFYGFLNSPKVNTERIGLAETDRLSELLHQLPGQLFLIAQDTTDLDYTKSSCASRMNSLNYAHRKGVYLHASLLTDETGLAYGLVKQSFFNRSADQLGKNRQLIPLKDKESYRWAEHALQLKTLAQQFPQHQFVNIADREGDFYEHLAVSGPKNFYHLIRASKNRKLADGTDKLFDRLAAQNEQQVYQTRIYDKSGQAHEVEFEVTYCAVVFKPSYRAKRDNPQQALPLSLSAVSVKQISPVLPGCKKLIHWRLLTTLTVENFLDAFRVIEYYVLRWRIERFFYVLKQGAKVEELQLDQPKAIYNAISVFSIVATQVLNLRYAVEQRSEAPIEQFGFTQEQYAVMVCFLNSQSRKQIPLESCTNVKQFIKTLERLASASVSNKSPGVRKLWTGIQKLNELMEHHYAFISSKNVLEKFMTKFDNQ